jgi:hypothetical protein
MPQKLMDVLMLGRCSHEFSWPRRSGQWGVLPGLLSVRNRLSVRLEDDASRKPGRRTGGRDHDRPAPLRSEAANLDARARRLKSSIPLRYRGKNLSTWYAGVNPEHQPVGRHVSRPATTAGECAGGTDLRDARRNLRAKEQQCALSGRLIRTKDAVENAEDAFG